MSDDDLGRISEASAILAVVERWSRYAREGYGEGGPVTILFEHDNCPPERFPEVRIECLSGQVLEALKGAATEALRKWVAE